MTHPGILKINELFNNKLSKEVSNIKTTVDYIGNFGNANLFNAIREELTRAGYDDINGQLDTLFCIIDSVKHDQIKISTIKNVEVRTIFNAFSKLLSFGKISFDSRVRRDLLMCIYLDNEYVHFETNFLKLDQHKQVANEFISILVKKGLFIQKIIKCRIETSDLYQQIYENAKSVITNMYSRGISVFAIACYFWSKNQNFIPKPLLYNWSNANFIKALMTTPLYESTASQEIKERLDRVDKEFTFWTVLSETSLLTGKVQNINKQRKEFNDIINKVLDAEGEQYIKEYLKRVKLIQSSTPVVAEIFNPKLQRQDYVKEIENILKNALRERTTEVPAKELIIKTIKYQFMISRIIGIDFSSKRKDHLVLDKTTKKRVFDEY